eukprot:GEMP01070181.1.p2 GENE.GEMP01070181.1~~GEMP01070181.1.p2  ORF type:complete len:142 (+),score=32.23 GEMP01070181.1:166-591(+)
MSCFSKSERFGHSASKHTNLAFFREEGYDRLSEGGFCIPGGAAHVIRKAQSVPNLLSPAEQLEMHLRTFCHDLEMQRAASRPGEPKSPSTRYGEPMPMFHKVANHPNTMRYTIQEERRRRMHPLISTAILFHKFDRKDFGI